jgi:hypothetical protein
MLLSFQRGRLEASPFAFEFGPNLDIIPRVNEIYEHNLGEDDSYREDIQRAHRNFLRQAIYSLYVNNRLADAARWYRYLGDAYPNKPVLDGAPNSFPRNVTLSEYALGRVQEDINDMSHDRMKSVIEGLLGNSYRSLIVDEDERALGFKNLAMQAYNSYENKIYNSREQALGLGPFELIDKGVLTRFLDSVPPEIRAALRTKLQLPAETSPGQIPVVPLEASPAK